MRTVSKKAKYVSPIIKVKKIKLNFFFTKTITDDFNVFGSMYIASGGTSECCCGDIA
jgi:hypothetical protein